MRYNEIITESKKASPQAIQAVLDWLKKQIEEHHESIEYIIDTGSFPDDMKAAFGISDIADGEALYKMRASQWEQAFKSHFGMTDRQYLKQCQAKHDETQDPRETQLLKFISSQVTYTVRLKPDGMLDDEISFYMMSPQKMVFRTSNMEVVILAKELATIGWTMPEMADFLVAHGASKMKRPTAPKAGRFSYYD